MIDFKTLLKENAAKQAEAAAKQNARGILHGSGITKRVATSAEKRLEKQQQKTTAVGEANLDQPAVLNASIASDLLPSTMMDENIELDADQIAAVQGIKNQKFSCLIGAAGTGKTTVTKAMIFEKIKTLPLIDITLAKRPDENSPSSKARYNVPVCITSFTGKAVQNIKRALPQEYHELCDTIHGTLGYCPQIEEFFDKELNAYREKRVFRPTFTALNKLPYKLVIIDEASMVPIYLWNELLAAMPDDCSFVLVGDINQLPPVQGRSVFGFAMGKWPTYALTKLHRQAAGDSIAINAHKILNGQIPVNCEKQFIIHQIPDGSLKAFTQVNAVIQHLHQAGKFDPMRDALIVPKNKGNLGQITFNERLVQYFNPVKKLNDVAINPRMIIKAGYRQVMYSVGDKVMLLSNDRKLGLTNGMVGVVEKISPNEKFRGEQMENILSGNDFDLTMDETSLDSFADSMQITIDPDLPKEPEDENERAASHTMEVKFQNVDTPVSFDTAGSFNKVAHAYAFTCHKSQGGEYPTVVVVCHASDLNMLTREWLYTAITRAQKRVILLVNSRGLLHAVKSQRIKGKTVAEKIERFVALETDGVSTVPTLPEPETI